MSEMDRLPPMTRYVLGLLRRGPSKPPSAAPEADALQEQHLAHLRQLRESGELITTGPLEEETPLRGLLVFRTDEIPRARELMRTDPLVAGGFLVLELYTWFAPAGLALSTRRESPTDLTFETD